MKKIRRSAMRAGIWFFALCAFPALAAEVAGTVQWSRRVELGMPVSGVVARVFVESGERVLKGQPLVQLDDRRYRTEKARAHAELTRLVKERDEAKREQNRAQELFDRNLLSNHELEVQKIAFVSAESRYQAARATLTQAELSLEYSTLRAPFDAWILDVRAEMGQAVVSDHVAVPLVTVAESGGVVIRILVSEGELQSLQNKKEVSVQAGGKRHAGVIKRIGLEPVAGGKVVQYPVDVVVKLAEPILRPGQKATVSLP
jgi:multidrug efflux system membrane fusion protein